MDARRSGGWRVRRKALAVALLFALAATNATAAEGDDPDALLAEWIASWPATADTAGPMASVARLADGGWIAVMVRHDEQRGVDAIVLHRFDAAFQALGKERIVHVASALAAPKIAAAPDGRYAVVWDEFGYFQGWDVRGRIFERNGFPLSPAFLANTYGESDQRNATVQVQPEGGFIVYWQSRPPHGAAGNGLPAVFAQRFTREGQRQGAEFAAGSEQENPAATAVDVAAVSMD